VDLVVAVADEDPFAALRLLQICGVQRFGHIISAIHPVLVAEIARSRDEDVQATFAAFRQEPPPSDSTHSLPVGAGGAALTSLPRHSSGSYLGVFFRVIGPLHQCLIALGGGINRNVAYMLTDPVKASDNQQWAPHVCQAHDAVCEL